MDDKNSNSNYNYNIESFLGYLLLDYDPYSVLIQEPMFESKKALFKQLMIPRWIEEMKEEMQTLDKNKRGPCSTFITQERNWLSMDIQGNMNADDAMSG